MPTISVIVPAFNAAETLGAALDSARLQTFRDIELVVVDDGSSDGTADVARAWMAAHSVPSRLLQPGRNMGPAAARNQGIQTAEGEWLAFLDADDLWFPHTLATLWNAVTRWQQKHPEDLPVFVCGHTAPFDATSATEPDPAPEIQVLNLIDFARDNPVPTSTVLVRKAAVTTAGGFDEQFRGPEDYDLWIRLAGLDILPNEIRRLRLLHVDTPLARYKTRHDSLSMNDKTFLPQVLRVLDKAYGASGPLSRWPRLKRKAQAHQYAGASWMAYRRGSRGEALKLLAKSYRHQLVMQQSHRWKLLARYLFGR